MFRTPYEDLGLPFPGTTAVLIYGLLRLVAAIAGSLTLGSLAYTLFCTATTSAGRVESDGYAGVRLAERASIIWAASALLLIPVTAADSAGLSVGTLLRHGGLGALIDAAERPKAWIVAAILTAVVAVLLRLTLSWNSLAGLATLSGVAVLCPAVVGNAGEGPDHDYATGAVIPFTLGISLIAGLTWCLAMHRRRGGSSFEAALHRYRVTLRCAVTVMIPTAAVLALILGAPTPLAIASACFLLTFTVLAWRTPARLLPLATGAAITWLAVSVAIAIQPAPAFANRSFTGQQVFLGFDLPQPPTVARLLLDWRFDIVLGTAAIVLAALYAAGAWRLRRRGDAWSGWRTAAWLTGCLALLLVTSSGIGKYGYAMFSVHMAIHMALNMFIPVLLVLGAPVTLLLRAVEPTGRSGLDGPREWVLSLMHSRFTAVLSNAIVALAVFVVSLYGLYFTPLFDQLIRFHWGHLLMNIHFMLTGYLFYWAIIGIDPGPRRLPHLGRLGMLFAVMPFHAFFGVAVMSMDTLIGQGFYPQLYLGWLTDLLGDQKWGGGLAWVSGEVPVLLVVGALLRQWATQDRKENKRVERHQDKYPDDDELTAYNAMLAKLSEQRG